MNLLLLSWLTASLSALPPSPAAIGSLLRALSTRCRMLLLHRCKPSVLRPTAIFDELLPVTVLMTPRATSHPPWHRRHGFRDALPASPPEPSSVTSHITRLCSAGSVTSLNLLRLQSGAQCASPAFTLSSAQQWNTARSSTCYRTSKCFAWSVHHSLRSRGLPVLQHDSPS